MAKARATSSLRRPGRVVLGAERRQRIRLRQWLLACVVYAGCALFLVAGLGLGWMQWSKLFGWCLFAVIGQGLTYTALRSGFSLRFTDPALTEWQAVLGVVAVNWAYLIAGSARSLALFPLLLIITFGAFSLPWRRIAWLTVFALACFLVCMAVLEWQRMREGAGSLSDPQLRGDLSLLAMLLIVLPALSHLAAHLSRLRSTLHEQRAALAQALADVQRLAAYDDLTGLANRRHAQDRLAQEQARMGRGAASFSLALIDLDRFKRVNDSLGHAGGDLVLRSFAEAARKLLRGSDMLARWGGEEFLLLMPDSSGVRARATLERLLEHVRLLPAVDGQPLSFSAGVAEFRHGESFTETIARADQQMYVVKNAGRNGVQLG